MPTRYIPVSDEEQKFGALVERVFSDQAFAKSIEANPAHALKEAGYHLTPEQVKSLEHTKVHAGHSSEDSLSLPAPTKPVVNVITKGTKPAVNVVTKGTQPAVSVLINSVVLGRAEPVELLTGEEVAKREKR